MGAFGTRWMVEYAAMLRHSYEDLVPMMVCQSWCEGSRSDKYRQLWPLKEKAKQNAFWYSELVERILVHDAARCCIYPGCSYRVVSLLCVYSSSYSSNVSYTAFESLDQQDIKGRISHPSTPCATVLPTSCSRTCLCPVSHSPRYVPRTSTCRTRFCSILLAYSSSSRSGNLRRKPSTGTASRMWRGRTWSRTGAAGSAA
jgi:hypothetical protein